MSHECWNVIGVRGNGSCSELEQHVHCRNCHVYSAAAAALLDRESADGTWPNGRLTLPSRSQRLSAHASSSFSASHEWLACQRGRQGSPISARFTRCHTGGGAVLGLANVRGDC